MSPDDWNLLETTPAPDDGSEFLAAYGHQGGVKKLIRWDRVHKRWMSKGEIAFGFETNVTHWMAIPKLPRRST